MTEQEEKDLQDKADAAEKAAKDKPDESITKVDDKDKNKFKVIDSQEAFDAAIESRLSRLRKSIRDEVTTEVTESAKLEEAKRQGDFESLYTQAQERIKEFEANQIKAEHEALRQKVAKEAGLQESAMKFLTGATEEELKVSATELAGMIAKPKEDADLDQGESNNRKPPVKRGKSGKQDYADPNFWGLNQGRGN